MRSHNIIHSICQSPAYLGGGGNVVEPTWYRRALALLRANGIVGESFDCFGNFFKQWPDILSKAYPKAVISKGWSLSGLCPLDILQILKHCLRFDSDEFTDNDRQRIVEVCFDLAKIQLLKREGVLSDEAVMARLGGLVTTELVGLPNLSIIRQRALWFCSEGQMHDGIVELRRAELARRTAAVAAMANAADAKQKRADKATAEALLKAQNPDLLLEANIIDSQDRLGMMCAAECNLNTREDNNVPDEWRCCANCDKVFCGKVACLKKRDAHIRFCLSRKFLREVEETGVELILREDRDLHRPM
jgi:hypothetical protein